MQSGMQEELERIIHPHLPQGAGTDSYLLAVQRIMEQGDGSKALLIFWCRPLMSVLDAHWPTRRETIAADELPDGALRCQCPCAAVADGRRDTVHPARVLSPMQAVSSMCQYLVAALATVPVCG